MESTYLTGGRYDGKDATAVFLERERYNFDIPVSRVYTL
jgi:hypothetical protein